MKRANLLLAGVILPIVAFLFDCGLRVDPIIWGGSLFGSSFGQTDIPARAECVYVLLMLSMLGMVITLGIENRPRWLNGIAISLLTLGFVFSLVHAIVFLPLVPVSAILVIAYGLGLLGLSPYFALWAYGSALREAGRRHVELSGGRRRALVLPVVAGLLPIALAVAPVVFVGQCVDSMRTGGPRAVSSGFRSLGRFACLAQGDLALLYPSLDAASQVRFRNLYLRTFGHDVELDQFRGFRR